MIKLFCDMGADISKDTLEKYNITMLNMPITDGTNEYIMDENITREEVFNNMNKGVKYSTSQVSFGDFYNSFKEEIENGNEILYISLSSGLSGTYNTSVMAKNKLLEEFSEAKIHIVDSLGASIGFGLMVLKSAKMLEDGCTLDEIIKFIETLKKHTEYIISVDDLTHLYRGGRLNKTKFIVGNLLNINPIMGISKETGKIEMIDKVRGKKALLKKINSVMLENKEVIENQTLYIMHGNCIEKAEEIRESIKSELNINSIQIKNIGAVIGCHTGDSIIALVYLNKLLEKYSIFEF